MKADSRTSSQDRRKFFRKLFPYAPGVIAQADGQKQSASNHSDNLRLTQKPGCVACGACVRGCENRALTFEDQDNLRSKFWDPELCKQCGKCVSRCPDHLLKFEQEPQAEAQKLTKTVLLQFKFRRCLGCGSIIAESEPAFCITCQRRGIAGDNFQ